MLLAEELSLCSLINLLAIDLLRRFALILRFYYVGCTGFFSTTCSLGKSPSGLIRRAAHNLFPLVLKLLERVEPVVDPGLDLSVLLGMLFELFMFK